MESFDERIKRRYEPATEVDLSPETIRDWGKKVLLDYVEHFVGKKGWEKIGAAPPDSIIDCLFSQIQVTLLGYARDMSEADAKRVDIDNILRVRKS